MRKDIDVDMDADSDMAVSTNWRGVLYRERAASRGLGLI